MDVLSTTMEQNRNWYQRSLPEAQHGLKYGY
jgi:hypothetical protein